jgi:membrane-associated phospholipid phosphatase
MKGIQSFFRGTSAIDALNLTLLGFLTIVLAAAFHKTPYRYTLLVCFGSLFLLIRAAALFRTSHVSRGWKHLVDLVYPIAFLFLSFETFFMLLPYFNENRYDAALIGVDFWMFGVHPTVWIEKWTHPVMTELMYSCYFLYFPMPFLAAILFFRNNRWRELEHSLFNLFFCYFGGYMTYFFVPATGPRFNLSRFQTIPLNDMQGFFVTEPVRKLIDFLEPNLFDVFPSLHTCILLTTMYIARRANKKLFNAYLPLAFGILISLIYCRYHYVIDVIAGAAWAVVSYYLSEAIYKRIKSNLTPQFGE